MASRRVGIDNSSAGKAVQKASGLSNALFGGQVPQLEESKNTEEEPKKEEQPKKAEEKPKKEPKKEQKKEEFDEEDFDAYCEELQRATHFLTLTEIYALKSYSYTHDMKLNECVRELLDSALPQTDIDAAKVQLKKRYLKEKGNKK